MSANEVVTAAVEAELLERGWNRARLARELGVSASWVTRHLDGGRRWSVDDLDRLGAVLGLSLTLCHEEDAAEPSLPERQGRLSAAIFAVPA